MPDNILFYLVFLSQILLISFYFPGKISSRMRQVIESYPPSKYPKLYPRPIEIEIKGQRNYRIMNYAIFVVGLILMVFVGLWDNSTAGKTAEGFPIFFGMLQFSPYIFLEISGFRQFKLMRKADLRTIRQAELNPRRLFDFISPAIIGTMIFMFFASILFDLYLHDFNFNWSHDTFQRTVVLTVTNLLLAGLILFTLYGKKLNPYQAYEDRIRQISLTIKSVAFSSILLCVYLMLDNIIETFDLYSFEIILNSLYFQIIAVISIGTLLRNLRTENINFDVYKVDPVITQVFK